MFRRLTRSISLVVVSSLLFLPDFSVVLSFYTCGSIPFFTGLIIFALPWCEPLYVVLSGCPFERVSLWPHNPSQVVFPPPCPGFPPCPRFCISTRTLFSQRPLCVPTLSCENTPPWENLQTHLRKIVGENPRTPFKMG